MSKGGPVSETEEAEILEALEAGLTTHQAAAKFDRAQSTISDVARRNGLDLADRSETKKAAIAKSNYATAERIKLIAEALNKGRELLTSCDNARDFQSIMTGLAIGIDKRRLEEGPGHGDKRGEITMLFDKMREEEAAGT